MVSMSSDFSILSDNDDLPMGWVKTTVGQVILPYETEQPTKKPDTEFTYIDISSIDNSTQTITDPKTFLGKDAPSRARRIVKEGDVLFSTVRTYLKNIALVSDKLDGALTSTGIAVLRPAKFVDSNWLFRFVTSENFVQEVGKSMDGSLYPAVTDKDVSDAPITLPPLNEQRRIVEKVEALMARSRKAKEALDAIPKLIEQFRQSVLAAAFRGDLTADWREQNPNIEPASVLLAKSLQKRRFLAEHGETQTRKIKYKEPIELIQETPFSIPETWTWASADQISSQITDGEHIQPPYQVEGLPMLSAKHVRNGYVDMSDLKFISKKDFEKAALRCFPQNGDILIVSVGATTGRAAIVSDCQPFVIVRSVLLLKPLLSPMFLYYWISSSYCQDWISKASGSTAQPHFYINDNKRMPIPLPPEEELEEIVRRVERMFVKIQRIEQECNKAMKLYEQLHQSILSKAFKGELVEQDPTDEPASVLLERIQKEREKEKAKVKQTGAKKLKK